MRVARLPGSWLQSLGPSLCAALALGSSLPALAGETPHEREDTNRLRQVVDALEGGYTGFLGNNNGQSIRLFADPEGGPMPRSEIARQFGILR